MYGSGRNIFSCHWEPAGVSTPSKPMFSPRPNLSLRDTVKFSQTPQIQGKDRAAKASKPLIRSAVCGDCGGSALYS